MELIAVAFATVVFILLAFRFGHDSRPHIRSEEEDMADGGFLIDDGLWVEVIPRRPVVEGQPFTFEPWRDRKLA